MESVKKPSAKYTDDVFLKSCSVLSFISTMLLIVALFLRMETINRRTEINEMRISDVESRMKISTPNKVDDKDEMKTSMSKYNTVYNSITACALEILCIWRNSASILVLFCTDGETETRCTMSIIISGWHTFPFESDPSFYSRYIRKNLLVPLTENVSWLSI